MSEINKDVVWFTAFNNAIFLFNSGELESLEVYDIIRSLWTNGMIRDSITKYMLNTLVDHHVDSGIEVHPKINQFIELLD